MSRAAANTSTQQTITVRVPMVFSKRGGRKLMIAPAGTEPLTPPRARIDSTLVKAIARAFRWKNMLESGQFGSISELAKAERINQSYLCRILRLTSLAPEIVETVLNGQQPRGLKLPKLLPRMPTSWKEQSERWSSYQNFD